MNTQLLRKLPNWYKEITNEWKVILTNDLDSLFTYLILRYLFKCEVGMFYDFESVYYFKNEKYEKDKLVGSDLAIECPIKTFCNHVTRIGEDDEVNPLSININNIEGIHRENYFDKYAGSTLLMVISLLDAWGIFGKLTEEQIKILVCVDSYFKGNYLPKHYEGYDAFKKYQKLLGLEHFQDVLDKYSESELKQFQDDMKLNRDIWALDFLNEYPLRTSINLEYLKEHFPMLDWDYIRELNFTKQKAFKKQPKKNIQSLQSKHELDRVFSFALINRREAKLTKR